MSKLRLRTTNRTAKTVIIQLETSLLFGLDSQVSHISQLYVLKQLESFNKIRHCRTSAESLGPSYWDADMQLTAEENGRRPSFPVRRVEVPPFKQLLSI